MNNTPGQGNESTPTRKTAINLSKSWDIATAITTQPEETAKIDIETADLDTISADLLLSIHNDNAKIEALVTRLLPITPNDDEIDKGSKQVIIEALKDRITKCDDDYIEKRHMEESYQYRRKCIQWLLAMQKIARKHNYKLTYIDDIFDHIYFTHHQHSWGWFWIHDMQDIMPNAGREGDQLQRYLEEHFEPEIKKYSERRTKA